MVRFALALCAVSLLCFAGCEGSSSYPRSGLDQRMFGPASIRIHPTFTQLRDWTGHGKPDGIEATLEIEDPFGEPTRATGRAIFELYEYNRESPVARGGRIGGPWIFSLNSKAQQQEHWNPALRAYTFQLPYPKAQKDQYYVLAVQFDLNSMAATTAPATTEPTTQLAGRLFDRLILEPQGTEKPNGPKRHAPTGAPSQF